MTSISVIIIAKNESHNIVECIHSCSFADEILVLDSGSSDDTVSLARSAGAKVIETDWPGYGPQKNRAVQMAQSEWVFSLDADERISSDLKDEVLLSINSGRADGFRVPRLSSFCGQFIRHSGWRPDYTLRLAKRHLARFSDHKIHEHMIVNGIVHDLHNSIIHYSYRNLNDVLDKLNRYSAAGASELQANKPDGHGLGTALAHGFWAFFRTYVIRAGFLDGATGLILAIYNGECTYYKYLKHQELGSSSRPPFS